MDSSRAQRRIARSDLFWVGSVGRALELKVLEEALQIARRGSGRKHRRGGLPGRGRERRLGRKFGLRARLARTLVVHTQVVGEQRGYGLMMRTWPSVCWMPPRSRLSAARSGFGCARHNLPTLAKKLGFHETQSKRALGRASEEWSEEARESSAGRLAILRALKGWLLELTRLRPLLLAIDDVGFADEVSLAWLANLAEEVREAKLLLVATRSHSHQLSDEEAASAEPKREKGKGEGGALDGLVHRAQLIELGPLGQAEAHELLGSTFGEVPHLRRLAERVYRTAQGNPAAWSS